MSPKPSEPPGSRPTAVGALALVACVVLGAWWIQRRATDARIERAIMDVGPVGLPTADEPIDDVLADLGAELVRTRCSACHAVTGEPRLGPNLAGVTRRRSLSWIRSMMLRPDSMTRADPDAQALRGAYGVQMKVPGPFGPAQARAVIEFLRRADAAAP
jgi:mono/diheme cytochrome c family protein